MGILRPSTEDSHPLMRNPSLSTSLSQSTSDGYVNEGVCDSEKAIANSCRQVLFATTDDVRYLNKESDTSHSNHSRPSAGKCCKSEFLFSKYFRHHFLYDIVKSNKKSMLSTSKVLQSDVMTLAEQNELKGAAWFQAGIPREICLEVLSRQHPGAFLVRKSSSKAGCFALSLRTPPPGPKVVHYLVLRTAKGYKIKVNDTRYSCLMVQFK
jgi:tensin